MTTTDDDIAGVYKPRTPENTPFYNCVENHFEQLESAWDDLYAPRYGFWRAYIKDVICRYLWTAATCDVASPGFDVTIAGTNIFWHFRANAGIFVRPAIRKG
jgi:hypothetical protein